MSYNMLRTLVTRSMVRPLSRSFCSPAASNDDVVITKSEGLMTLRLNRPKKLNSITPQMYDTIIGSFESAATDDSIKMVMLTGTGKYYSSGNDLSIFMGVDDPVAAMATGAKLFNRFIFSFVDFPKPLVAAVNGPAVGVTVTTLALCDLVFCSDTATFKAPFSSTAQCPEGGSTLTFPAIMGTAMANDIFMLDRSLTAKEALDLKLVSRILPTENFQQTVETELKKALNNLSYESMLSAKKLIQTPERKDLLKKVMLRETEELVSRWKSDDFPEFLMKFLSRKGK